MVEVSQALQFGFHIIVAPRRMFHLQGHDGRGVARQYVVLLEVLQVVLQLIGDAEGFRVGFQHRPEMKEIARATQTEHQRNLKGRDGLVAEDVHDELHWDGRTVPCKLEALSFAESDVSVGNKTEQFGIITLRQDVVAEAKERVASVDGKGIAIEGIDGRLAIAGVVAVFHIVVDE